MSRLREDWKQRALADGLVWSMGVGMAVVAAVAFVLGGLLAWMIVGDAAATPDRDVHEAAHQADDAEPQLYTCSMHPRVRSEDPDDLCPECAMALIPVDEGDQGDAGLPVFRADRRAQALLQVQLAPVERRAVEREVDFFGQLQADERRHAQLAVRSDSYIDTLHTDYRWQPVTAGQPIAELYSPDVVAAARELMVVARDDAPRERTAAYESARARLARLGVSEQQIDRIVASGDVPRTHTIRSPIDGVVQTIGGRAGHWLNEGDHLVEIVDLSSLWVQLEAFERDLPWVGVGDRVTFETASPNGRTLEGRVAFVEPVVDPRSRTARVRIDVPNEDRQLKPGMYVRGRVHAEITIHDGEKEKLEGGVVPRSAVLVTGRRAVVYVAEPSRVDEDDDRMAYWGREVTLGPRVGDAYVILDGLEEGELVVTRGNFRIDSELQIQGRPSMMSPDGMPATPHHHQHHIDADDEDHDHDHDQTPDDPSVAAAISEHWPDVQRMETGDAIPHAVGRVARAYFDVSEMMSIDEWDDLPHRLDDVRTTIDDINAADLEGEPRQALETFSRHAQRVAEAANQMQRHWQNHSADDEDAREQAKQRIRRIHVPMSDAVITLIAKFGAEDLGPVYLAHCFMATGPGQGGEWVQTTDTINRTNPYMGLRMARCGSIEGQLNWRHPPSNVSPGDQNR